MVQIWRKTRESRMPSAGKVIKLIYLSGVVLGLFLLYNARAVIKDNGTNETTFKATKLETTFKATEIETIFKATKTETLKPKLFNRKVPNYPSSNSWFRNVFNASNVIRPGDPLVTLGSGWDVSPVVVTEYKLIFFTVPKIGATVFKQLFRRMMGYEDWLLDKGPYPHQPAVNGLVYLYNLPPAKIQEFMTSPNWTRAVFVRDPKDRLLSAYLDKALRDNGTYVKRRCCGIKPNKDDGISFQKLVEQHQQQQTMTQPQPQRGSNLILAKQWATTGARGERGRRRLQTQTRATNLLHSQASYVAMQAANNRVNLAPAVPPGTKLPQFCKNLSSTEESPTISFEVFVQDFLIACNDPHWRPQAKRMGEQVWDQINFVGSFGRLEKDTRRMLEKIGAWEKYGPGWPNMGTIFAENVALHKTSAHDHIKEYYTPELERMVDRFYRRDYEHSIMNFARI